MQSLPANVHRGHSMIEVLVTVVILAIGLMGVAVLMAVSVRQQHETRIRTQAIFVGEAIMERMHANLIGVWSGAYDGDYDADSASSSSAQACDANSPCTPLQMASRDTESWGRELSQFLTNGSGAIVCQLNSTPVPGELSLAPPVDGYCDVTVQWDEISNDSEDAFRGEIAWRFVP